jgi:hypothetical protein
VEENVTFQVEGKPAAQEKSEKMLIRASADIAGLIVGLMIVAVLAVLAATADSAHDKYSLTSPGGIAFSDFRGYEVLL